MRTVQSYYRVDRRKINIVKFIFEAYEGVATVTTIDATSGGIVVAMAPGCEEMVKEIMDEMAGKFSVEAAGETKNHAGCHKI
jgi:pantothenate kinase type III